MESILGIATLVGLVLLVIGYLLIVFAGFRHHTMTGIIAMIPVLNILIIPSTWHRASAGFIIGTVGLVVATIGWLLGGSSYFYQHFSIPKPAPQQQTANQQVQPSAVPLPQGEKAAPKEEKPAEEQNPLSNRPIGAIIPLPDKPLYKLVYKDADRNELKQLIGEYIRITDKKKLRYEGKLENIKGEKISLKAGINTADFKLSDIAQIEKIVKTDQD
ncbi:MAG: hypothetical protein ACWA5U_08220 [bacterium]